MSHLLNIIEKVKLNGFYEEPWNVLLNSVFRGDDGFDQLESWAKTVNLKVTYNQKYKTCTFLEDHNQSNPPPHA
jgi:hypothetical protein